MPAALAARLRPHHGREVGDALRPAAGAVHGARRRRDRRPPARGGPRLAVGPRGAIAAEIRLGSLDPLLKPGGGPARAPRPGAGPEPGSRARASHVTVISPQGAMTAVGLVPKMRRFEVAGLVEVGMYEYDSSLAYTSLAAAQEFAGLGDRVTGIEVKLDDPWQARIVSQRLTGRARRAVLGARLDGHEQESLRRAPAREAGALRHRHDHRPGRGLRHRRPPRAAGGREAEGDRDPQGDGGERGQHRRDLPRGRHADRRGGDGGGQRPRACS